MNRRLKVLRQQADDVTFAKEVHQNTNFNLPARKRKKTQNPKQPKNLLHTAKEYSIVGNKVNSTDTSGLQANAKKNHVYTPDLVTDDPRNYRQLRTEYNHSFLESRPQRQTPEKSEAATTTDVASPGLRRMGAIRKESARRNKAEKPLESIH